LRILEKQPDAIDAYRAELFPALGDARIAQAATALERDLLDRSTFEYRARNIVERMALLWQAALLLQHAPPFVADAFVRSRVAEPAGRTLGTLGLGTDLRAIVDRAAIA